MNVYRLIPSPAAAAAQRTGESLAALARRLPRIPTGRPSRARRSSGAGGPRRRRRWIVIAVLLGTAALGAVVLPSPAVDLLIARQIRSQVAATVACPGAAEPDIDVGGGRLLPQVLGDRLDRLRIKQTDTPAGGARRATVVTTLTGVRGLQADTQSAEQLTTTVTIRFGDLPAPADAPRATMRRAEDGRLVMALTAPKEQVSRTTSVARIALRLRGESVVAEPQSLRLFGRTLPANQVEDLTGGTRVQALPDLPNGVRYTSIRPEKDGVHVGLNGVAVTPLSTLPTKVDGRTVSYTAERGLLGIVSRIKVPLLIDEQLTIFARPRITRGTLFLDPVSVRALGDDHAPDSLIGLAVLSQVNKASLQRKLPAIPPGVRFKSVTVDRGGVKVAVGGVTVQPFSSLEPPVKGAKSTFGADRGLLTVTTVGGAGASSKPPMVLTTTPRIVDGPQLDLTPEQLVLFGIEFNPQQVFAETGAAPTKYPMQALPPVLKYTGVEVLDDALRFSVRGENVTLSKDLLGSTGGCA